jgi:hypothetical protein
VKLTRPENNVLGGMLTSSGTSGIFVNWNSLEKKNTLRKRLKLEKNERPRKRLRHLNNAKNVKKKRFKKCETTGTSRKPINFKFEEKQNLKGLLENKGKLL